MADYRDRLEEWREAARRKARELDDKYGIKDRVEGGARAAQDAARRGAEKIAEGAERAKREAERLTSEQKISEQARQAADEAARVAREAGDAFRGATRSAGEAAGEVFSEARNVYERASQAASRGARVTRASTAAASGFLKARRWAKDHPRRAAAVTFSIAAGLPLGFAFPRLDSILFGAHPHWFTHSALPVYALRKAGEKFDQYLKRRESLLAAGKLDDAERERVEFERKIARYVGAPLLGAFSCAAGVGMWAQIFQPGRITGAPISWLLGGNPVLDAVWLFANGVLCIQQGYKFFMIALEDQEDVERVLRELKGFLPAQATAG